MEDNFRDRKMAPCRKMGIDECQGRTVPDGLTVIPLVEALGYELEVIVRLPINKSITIDHLCGYSSGIKN